MLEIIKKYPSSCHFWFKRAIFNYSITATRGIPFGKLSQGLAFLIAFILLQISTVKILF